MSYLIINEQTLKLFRCNTLNDVVSRIEELKNVHREPIFPETSADCIFHNALDMDKVKKTVLTILNLKDEKGKKVFRFQKLWYVVYRVLVEMDWLQDTKATKFRAWLKVVYDQKGHCTKQDFDKVCSRFKNNPTKSWKAYADNEKPYVEVARSMWELFQGADGKKEELYCKPQRYIWHRNTPR